MLEQTGLRDRADERSDASRAATASASTSRSACSRAPRCCCSTSPPRRWTPASASACGSSSSASPSAARGVVFATHDIAEAERHAARVLVLADGELLFSGPPASSRAPPEPTASTSRARSSRSCASGATDAVRCCARTCGSCAARRLLVGAADRLPGRDRPADRARALARARPAAGRVPQRISPPGRASSSGGRRLDSTHYYERALQAVKPVPVATRAQAVADVRPGACWPRRDHPRTSPHGSPAATSRRTSK